MAADPCTQVRNIEVGEDGYAMVMTDTGITRLEQGTTVQVPIEVFVRLLKGQD